MNSPRIKLSNGLTIANFSSPHPFTFTTGEILPACKPRWVKRMSLSIEETIVHKGPLNSWNKRLQQRIYLETNDNSLNMSNILIVMTVPRAVINALVALDKDSDVDIVLIPFMVMQALRDDIRVNTFSIKKCRVIRCADRVTKEIYPDKFCV